MILSPFPLYKRTGKRRENCDKEKGITTEKHAESMICASNKKGEIKIKAVVKKQQQSRKSMKQKRSETHRNEGKETNSGSSSGGTMWARPLNI